MVQLQTPCSQAKVQVVALCSSMNICRSHGFLVPLAKASPQRLLAHFMRNRTTASRLVSSLALMP